MLRCRAWCGLILGYTEPVDDRGVTHGFCRPCAGRIREECQQMAVDGTERGLAGATTAHAAPSGLPVFLFAIPTQPRTQP
jgi:hypothetical protein